ncbi:MAG: alpha/beta fold hydrolase [Bacteriovoracia bacterium]
MSLSRVENGDDRLPGDLSLRLKKKMTARKYDYAVSVRLYLDGTDPGHKKSRVFFETGEYSEKTADVREAVSCEDLLFDAVSELPVCQKYDGVNRTSEFETLFQSASAHPLDATTIAKLKSYRILLVSGMMTQEKDLLSILSRGYIGHTFGDQKNYFTDQGLDFVEVASPTLGLADQNAHAVREAILASDKPVILISHSYGGIAALSAIAHDSVVGPKVAGWISLQAPFLGTTFADMVGRNDMNFYFVAGLLEQIGAGDGKFTSRNMVTGSVELTAELGHAVLAATPELVASLHPKRMRQYFQRPLFQTWMGSGAPMISVTTETDFFVKLQEGILPGSEFVVLQDVPDHAATVGYRGAHQKAYDRVGLTRSLLLMLARRLP